VPAGWDIPADRRKRNYLPGGWENLWAGSDIPEGVSGHVSPKKALKGKKPREVSDFSSERLCENTLKQAEAYKSLEYDSERVIRICMRALGLGAQGLT
jgi:hypothetical protein